MQIGRGQNSWFDSAEISRLKAGNVAFETIEPSRATLFICCSGGLATEHDVPELSAHPCQASRPFSVLPQEPRVDPCGKGAEDHQVEGTLQDLDGHRLHLAFK